MDFFLSTLNISYHTLWPERFLLGNPLIALWRFSCIREFFSLAAFKILPLSLILFIYFYFLFFFFTFFFIYFY